MLSSVLQSSVYVSLLLHCLSCLAAPSPYVPASVSLLSSVRSSASNISGSEAASLSFVNPTQILAIIGNSQTSATHHLSPAGIFFVALGGLLVLIAASVGTARFLRRRSNPTTLNRIYIAGISSRALQDTELRTDDNKKLVRTSRDSPHSPPPPAYSAKDLTLGPSSSDTLTSVHRICTLEFPSQSHTRPRPSEQTFPVISPIIIPYTFC
ncbi:hypothetical protein C8J55DRAFT_603153 [Lentinula edodes]|uniref:Uncharacterized protein n=1 Tax=Lentinula lateritia TaxID=40482 RepID=A0A9W9AWH3_9AGAR|nr:hypothetical protein C8J55DRAFT_603153 [Lentinula edodes]